MGCLTCSTRSVSAGKRLLPESVSNRSSMCALSPQGGSPFDAPVGVLVSPHFSVEEVEDTDIALVAARVISASTPPKDHDERNFDWLLNQQGRGTTMASACTGAVMLAEAGLLNGWKRHPIGLTAICSEYTILKFDCASTMICAFRGMKIKL